MNETMDAYGFEQRVRDRAYAIWESEGRPAGRDAEHWRLSEEATLAELAPAAPAKTAKPKPAPRKKAAAPKRSKASVEMSASL